jgi:hypothetical protein
MQSLEDFTPDVCQQLLAAAAGVSHLPVAVHQVKSWVMSALVRHLQVLVSLGAGG